MKKNRLMGAVTLTVLGLSLLVPSGRCQGPSSSSSPNPKSGLPPTAPPLPPPSTCTQKNGKPFPKWLHTVIGQYPIQPQTPPYSLYFWTHYYLQKHSPQQPPAKP